MDRTAQGAAEIEFALIRRKKDLDASCEPKSIHAEPPGVSRTDILSLYDAEKPNLLVRLDNAAAGFVNLGSIGAAMFKAAAV